MEMEKIIEKITQYRNRKGYTYENMAHDLHITPAAYRKIETGETKLTVERLFKIAEILDIKVSDLLNEEKSTIYNQDLKDNAIGHQQIENLHQENKEVYQELLKAKDEQIHLLKEQINFYKSRIK